MTKYQELRLISMITYMVQRLSADVHQEEGQGLRLHGYEWLTPTECHFLRSLIEKHQDAFCDVTWPPAQELITRLQYCEKKL